MGGSGREVGWGGRLFETGRLFEVGANSRLGAYSNKCDTHCFFLFIVAVFLLKKKKT